MTIAVMSDLHDNVKNWELINAWLTEHQITTLINCGDTAAPAMLQDMARTFKGTIHTIFGNVADRALEQKVAPTLTNVKHYGDEGAVTFKGRRIGFVHFPDRAQAMATSGDFDLVCHGHTHLKRWEKIGDCWILNPGTAGGMFQYPTFAIMDLSTMKTDFHMVTM